LTVEEFKNKFIKNYKLQTKAVIAYINKLEKENEKLKEVKNND